MYWGSKVMPAVAATARAAVGRRRVRNCFKPPVARRLDAEFELEPHQLVPTRDEQCHRITRCVLIEPRIELVGTHAEVIDRKNLIIHVQAGGVRRGLAANLCHHQTSAIIARGGAEPGTSLTIDADDLKRNPRVSSASE